MMIATNDIVEIIFNINLIIEINDDNHNPFDFVFLISIAESRIFIVYNLPVFLTI